VLLWLFTSPAYAVLHLLASSCSCETTVTVLQGALAHKKHIFNQMQCSSCSCSCTSQCARGSTPLLTILLQYLAAEIAQLQPKECSCTSRLWLTVCRDCASLGSMLRCSRASQSAGSNTPAQGASSSRALPSLACQAVSARLSR
jgi:hypothetical protein